MGKRRDFTAQNVPLVGGALALDFLNTTGNRDRQPRERLHGYADLVVWGKRAGLLNPPRAEAFRARARERSGAARKALGRALELREDIYAVLAPLAVGEAPTLEAVHRLDGWFAEACPARSLRLVEGRVEWTWQPDPARLDSLLWPILASVQDVLAMADRVRRCGECDWLFIDESKNSTRQWCKKLCADRVRSRRYYGRKKGG